MDKIFNVTLKKDGWFSKFYKFSTNLSDDETPTSNGCKVAWTTLFAIILLPLTWWNIPYNLVVDHYDRPSNLFGKAFLGVLAYTCYFILIGIGFGLFVGGTKPNGEEYGYLFNLFTSGELGYVSMFIFLPLLSLVTIGILSVSLLTIIALIAGVKDLIVDYYDDKFNKDDFDIVDDKENNNTSWNIIKLFLNLINKICPVINWK